MNIVYLLTTGGTIEKVYSERTGSVNNVESKIDRYLHALRLPDADIHVVSIMNKDSLEMTDDDRALILEIVRGVLTEKAPIYYGVVAKEYWPTISGVFAIIYYQLVELHKILRVLRIILAGKKTPNLSLHFRAGTGGAAAEQCISI
jgi:hypothetical protein